MLRDGSVRVFIGLLILTTFSIGCSVHKTGSAHRAAKYLIIPKRCVGIDVQSFTQPCVEQGDGKIICNGVVIRANCIKAR